MKTAQKNIDKGKDNVKFHTIYLDHYGKPDFIEQELRPDFWVNMKLLICANMLLQPGNVVLPYCISMMDQIKDFTITNPFMLKKRKTRLIWEKL